MASFSPTAHAPSRPHFGVQTLLRVAAASSVAQGDGGAWVTDDIDDRLISFDPTTGHTERSVALAGRPVAMILNGRDLWVADMVKNLVEEFSAGDLHLVRSIPVPVGPSGLATLHGVIWVASVDAGEVTPINPGSGIEGQAVPLSAGAVRIAAGFGALWVTGVSDTLTEMEPPRPVGAAPVLHTITVGDTPIGVATGDGSVWVANSSSGTVTRVDPLTRATAHTYGIGGDPLAIAVAGGNVWVGDGSAARLRTVFPTPGLAPVFLGGSPRSLLSVGDGVWITTANPARVLAARVSG